MYRARQLSLQHRPKNQSSNTDVFVSMPLCAPCRLLCVLLFAAGP